MFNLKSEPQEVGGSKINAILGKGAQFEGKLIFEGTVRIDGKFSGEIVSDDQLIIGESADVNAEIKVNNIIISGNVVGNIEAKGKVEIQAPGKLKGNIKAPALVINEGVMFDGHCQMAGEKSVRAPKTEVVPEGDVITDAKFKKADTSSSQKK